MDGAPVRAYSFPKLFTLKCMVTGLFVAGGEVGNAIHRRAEQATADGRLCRVTMLRNLHVLLNEYIPTGWVMWVESW